MNQTKRIVIIEGDAFDADAIVAIVKADSEESFSVYINGMDAGFEYEHGNEIDMIEAMAVAVHAWRWAVGDVPTIPPGYIPINDPPPDGVLEVISQYWSDTKGRYYETYGGSTIYTGSKTGRFIWNEGPPRRKNTLGPGASPIVKVYIDQEGKPIDPQPV